MHLFDEKYSLTLLELLADKSNKPILYMIESFESLMINKKREQ